MADEEARGSDKLVEELAGGGGTALPKEQLRELIQATRAAGGKLIDWWELGQPDPEWIGGAVVVPHEGLGDLVRGLQKTGPRIILDGFPYGIPDPRELIVKFQVSQQRGR